MNKLVCALPENPLDIIGDIHGEIDALKALLSNLGYIEGKHKEGRHLVFVGDLSDRGPDSPAVISLVMDLVEKGLASMVMGNHELNLMRQDKKTGNWWFFGLKGDKSGKYNLNYTMPEPALISKYKAFIRQLPLVLEREDLRVVHACYDQTVIDSLKKYKSVEEADNAIKAMTKPIPKIDSLSEGYNLHNEEIKPPFLKAVQDRDYNSQMLNPVKIITSGPEKRISEDEIYYEGGRWRFLKRDLWWNDYNDSVPVICGHYWRRMEVIANTGHPLKGYHPIKWFGSQKNVFCVDYSAGKRYIERAENRLQGTTLAAMRWPERQLVTSEGAFIDTN